MSIRVTDTSGIAVERCVRAIQQFNWYSGSRLATPVSTVEASSKFAAKHFVKANTALASSKKSTKVIPREVLGALSALKLNDCERAHPAVRDALWVGRFPECSAPNSLFDVNNWQRLALYHLD